MEEQPAKEDPTDDGKVESEKDEVKEEERTLSHLLESQQLSEPEVDFSQCPTSYKENSTQEKLLLAMAHNFHCQYAHLYPGRKSLLLCPLNECGIQKFVSTTLRPTLSPYPELYSWEGCSSFVSDFLTHVPLSPLINPTQRGSSFDFATLLCSLLLGAGYDAYCISGYAVKEMCLLNQSRKDCPLLVKPEKVEAVKQKPPENKYSVKRQPELVSEFERQQERRRWAEAQAAELRRQQEEQRLEEEQERPHADPLLGLRVHCWVLVLCGSRDVPENFFIDPLTGRSFPTTDTQFLSVESVWNHQNYWVNMQDCHLGCAEMTYDFGNVTNWESLLCGSGNLMLQSLEQNKLQDSDEEDEEDKEESKVLEMPLSWVKKIDISVGDMEKRLPEGKKVIEYRKASLEKFAPYLQKDGLVMRLTTYRDLDCTQTSTVKEWFQHRHDFLEERELSKVDNKMVEQFQRGRSHALKTHRYVTLAPETEREMEFYSHARVDGLAKRVENPTEMTETFEKRTDFLYHRHVVFGRMDEVGVLVDPSHQGQRPIQKILERFYRDRSKPASHDIAERVFLSAESGIEVTYHLEDDRIIPARCSFTKPHKSEDTWKQQPFAPNMVSNFQVDPFEKPRKNLFLYEMLVFLMKEEKRVAEDVRDSEKEVRAILALREEEERSVQLHISIYDTARNEKVQQHREEMERLAKEDHRRKEEQELDYLALFLARQGDPKTLTRQAAQQLRSDCLADLKQQLINKANRIQACLQKETGELQLKQKWYQENQLSLTKEEESTYLTYCSDALFRIRILKQRLSRHKDLAPQKYLALEEKLGRDPRLASHLL